MSMTSDQIYDWIVANWTSKSNYRESADVGIPTDTPSHFLIHNDITTKKIYTWDGNTWSAGLGGGSGSLTVQNVASATNIITAFNKLILVDASLNNVTVILPSSTSLTIGQSLCVKRTDNSNYTLRIIANGTEIIDGSTNSIYLYGQNDCVTLTSTAVGKIHISADNRNSTGSSASYLKVTRGTTVAIADNTNIKFPTVEDSQGTDISYDTSTGIVKLKANIKYRLRCAINMMTFSSDNAYAELKFYNITASQFVGISGSANPITRNTNEAKILETEYTFTPIVETQISPRLTVSSNISSITTAWLEVEEISHQATVIQTVDYCFARVTSNVTTANTIIPVSLVVGNIEVSNNMFYLKVGSTYELEAFIEFNGNTGSVWAEYVWTDSVGTYLPTSTTGLSVPVQSASADSSLPTKAIITPTQNMSVKVMTTGTVAGITGIALTRSYFKITQIGSTACTDSITLNTINSTSSSGLNVHTKNTITPTKLGVTNEFVGQNGSGSDYEISALNLGNDMFYASVSTKIPVGAWGDGCRMDFSTPAGSNSNVQIPRMSILPFSGNVGIGTTEPNINDKVTIKGTTTDGTTNIINGLDNNDISVFKVDTNGKLTTNDVVTNIVSTADGTNGYVTMNSGGTRTGFFEWKKPDDTRLGFMGDGEFDINLALENDANFKIVSTTGGFLVPKMTRAQKDAIISPISGLEVYVTDESSGKYIYNGTRWDKVSNLAYLKASNIVAVNPAANILLNFSSGVVSNGIKTNHGNGQYTLYPGVYELMGVQLLNENDAGISYQFYNYTTSSYTGEQGNNADVAGSAGTGSPAFAILECTVDTQIGLRCTNDSATVTASLGNWLKIRQIS